MRHAHAALRLRRSPVSSRPAAFPIRLFDFDMDRY
jgi:hypothetical protein